MTPPAPKYAPGEVVYLSESVQATGSLDALKILTLRYTSGGYLYQFDMGPRPPVTPTVGDRNDLREKSFFELPESVLLTMCEAMEIQVSVLQRRVQNARNKYESMCPGTYTEDRESPKYDIDEVVYVRQSAAVVGALEAVKITRFRLVREVNQYYYKYSIGGKESPFEVPESELVLLCDALVLQINVLESRLTEATAKYEGLCGGGSSG